MKFRAGVAIFIASLFFAEAASANCVSCTAPGNPGDPTVWSLILEGCGLCGLQADHAGTPRVSPINFDPNDPGRGLISVGDSTSATPAFNITDNGSSYTVGMSSSFVETSGKRNTYGIYMTEVVDKQTAAIISVSIQLSVYNSSNNLLGQYKTTDDNPSMFSIGPSTYEFVYSNGTTITLQQNFDPNNPLAGAQPTQYPGVYFSSEFQTKMFVPTNL
jgi:hypothetical protein